MSQYQIQLTKAAQKVGNVSRWWLDFPVKEQDVLLQQLRDGIVFQGWVLSTPGVVAKVYVKQGNEISYFELDRPRPDVIEIILKTKPLDHPQVKCGFKFNLAIKTGDFELGLAVNEVHDPLVSFRVVGPCKVLHGKEGWLFLDNDTNKSVEQFTGKLLLSELQLQQWNEYFTALALIEQQVGKAAMLVAPSKELVYPQFYPIEKAGTTAYDQLLALPLAKAYCIDPSLALGNAERRTFRIVDTHWAAYGGSIAVQQLGAHFGVAAAQLSALFAKDQYRPVVTTGDLGLKFYPPLTAEEELLTGFNYRGTLIYDNSLPNFGRVMLTSNAKALLPGHILIFGSSSSYPMLDYLVRLFAKVTLIHTAGNVDPTVVTALKPDYFLTQTNARFIVSPPSARANLRAIMAEKLCVDGVNRTKIIDDSAQQMTKNTDERLVFFHQLLI